MADHIRRLMFLLLAIVMVVPLVPRTVAAAPAPPGPMSQTAPPDNYVLGAGDQIDVVVFGQPDLTTASAIRPDGMIALPLVGDVRAGGKTAPQLEAELTRLYRKYLKAPAISVAIKQFSMNHIYVMGEVAKPGRYDLTDNMTVLDALTLAGGSTNMANLDGTQISRSDGGKSKAIAVKFRQLMQGKDAGQNLRLQRGDLVYVPRRGLNLLDILQNLGTLRYAVGF
jgi:polysaccharide biosynthesis/export protein